MLFAAKSVSSKFVTAAFEVHVCRLTTCPPGAIEPIAYPPEKVVFCVAVLTIKDTDPEAAGQEEGNDIVAAPVADPLLVSVSEAENRTALPIMQ